MIKKISVRVEQAIKYTLVNLFMLLHITNKIYLPSLSSPIYVRRKSSDLLAFHQIFTFKEYEMNLGFKPKFIIDAGANIGLAAVYFAKKYPNAKIIAIEPESSNFEMLKKNSNNYKNIFLHKRALSNQSNLVLNVIDKGFGNWGFMTEIDNNRSSQNIVDTVKTITIDDIIKENNLEYIDLLKIDIEGGEKELFESNYENWLPKTKCIAIELHDGIKVGSSKSFFEAISNYNFSYHNKGGNLIFMNRDIL
jgi:FkbM family methyltransferase